jgi:hypothetical protein
MDSSHDGTSAAFGELLVAFEIHSVERIREALDSGIDARVPVRGKLPIEWLTEMYMRSERFPDCLRVLLQRGAELPDPKIEPVLLDDADALRAAVQRDPSLLEHKTTMVSTFTPLVGASLLHVAAEYGSARAASALMELGADVEARAARDEFGMNGHTPIFHTGNSLLNHSAPILRMLLDASARTDVHLAGITWGKGFEWETTCFDVTPISYAQLGLLPQMHRKERDVYENAKLMLEAVKRRVPPLANVPNRYLAPRRNG